MSDEPLDDDEVFVLPIEDFIDLHPFRPKDIRAVVASYLEEAVRLGFTEVRLIHGRGIGVQREAVRAVLKNNACVLDFHDAPAERGGWGATVVRLLTGFDVG
jgi:dsDNA-specific endonuclease/ATPase MutS2